MLRFEGIDRALVVCAHPDDVDFGAAGTVARLTDAGVDVTYCIVTDGDAGGFDPSISRPGMAALRREEQTAAAKEVGVHQLIFLGEPDGRLQPTLDLRRRIAAIIRRVRPHVVITQSTERNLARIYASHPDHLATAEATLCAVYPDARNPFAFPDLLEAGLEPWTVGQVWVMGGPAPDHAVDITDQVERKMRALRCHESQHPDPDGMEARVRSWVAAVAQQHGLGEGRAGEAFLVVDTA